MGNGKRPHCSAKTENHAHRVENSHVERIFDRPVGGFLVGVAIQCYTHLKSHPANFFELFGCRK